MRRLLTALATAAMASALPAVALASSWTMTVSPTTVTQNQSTTFTFTMTNLDTSSKFGCLEVDLPSSFVISSVSDPNASNGDDWDADLNGTNIEVYSDGGGGRLDTGESVTFTIIARGTAAGTYSWTNHAHTNHNCNGSDLTGAPLQVTVTGSATPTPVPTPVPTAVPRPPTTPVPTPVPTPDPTGSVPPVDRPTPTEEPSSTPEPSASARPATPTPEPSPSAGPAALTVAPLDESSGGGGSDDFGSSLDILALLDGPFVWFVPGAAVGVPGLVVVAFVALQGVGAMAWIPAMRRLGGDDRRRRLARLA